MIFKKFLLVISLVLLIHPFLFAKEEPPQGDSDQQISDFSLSGYGEKGKKSWDLSGKSADIFPEVVKLNDVIGNMYGKEENISLTADKGDFNKKDGKVHLEDNVVITTTSGTKMTTDSLDWDRKNQLVSTDDVVNIKRDNMTTQAKGARGEPNLKKVALEKDVVVDILSEAAKNLKSEVAPEKTQITCDGPLQIDYATNIATFNNNVKVERPDLNIYSDKMDVYFIPSKKGEETKDVKEAPKELDKSGGLMGTQIDKIVCRGNVKIERGENISYSDEATYSAADKKITLSGKPRLVIYSTETLKGDLDNASLGN